jgi:hypothetical protein
MVNFRNMEKTTSKYMPAGRNVIEFRRSGILQVFINIFKRISWKAKAIPLQFHRYLFT